MVNVSQDPLDLLDRAEDELNALDSVARVECHGSDGGTRTEWHNVYAVYPCEDHTTDDVSDDVWTCHPYGPVSVGVGGPHGTIDWVWVIARTHVHD